LLFSSAKGFRTMAVFIPCQQQQQPTKPNLILSFIKQFFSRLFSREL
jgi:hypothetical protein